MARKKVNGRCHLCGTDGELSFEHVPPQSAFNRSRIFEADSSWMLEQAKTLEEFGRPPTRQNQRGAGGYTLCEDCNSITGHRYVPAYVAWAEQGMRHLNAHAHEINVTTSFTIEPLRVIKQVMCMFASACGPELFNEERDLRKFVLDQTAQHLPPRFRVYTYFVHPASYGSRQSGISVVIDASRGGAQIQSFSEISFRPFGYLLMIDSVPTDPQLQEITFFADEPLGTAREVHLTLPVRSVNSPVPGDFRSPEQIANDWARNTRGSRNG